MSELWPVGTWVAIKITGHALRVSYTDPDCMRLTPLISTIGDRLTSSRYPYVEIPPKPDEEALKRQGYRLTGMAADCSKEGHGHLWVYGDEPIVYDGEVSTWDICEGWRWLVERIEEEPSEPKENPHLDSPEYEDRVKVYQAGYKAGWAACRDRAIRILSSRKEHGYE